MKKIVILGSTGCIGKQTLEIISAYPHEFKVVGLSAHKNKELLERQALEFNCRNTAVGEKDLVRLATLSEADLIVVAVIGLAGLGPTLDAIRAKKNVALATKEVLVVAGEMVMREAKKNKVKIIPLDSEHSAVFQCKQAGRKKEIKRIILTMGKGRFATMSPEELEKVKLKNIYEHPTWRMGNKITIDSATCLNKSFEVIEAKWLFDIPKEKISIIVHPERLCHSLVEFKDGSIIGEFGSPDMRRYIQYALFYPERREVRVTQPIDLVNKKISFEPAPYKKFPGLHLGFRTLEAGGTLGAVMHGADDIAVKAFVKGSVKFTDIASIVEETMRHHKVTVNPNLNELLKAEQWGRKYAGKLITGLTHFNG